jgi:hypothetical protein
MTEHTQKITWKDAAGRCGQMTVTPCTKKILKSMGLLLSPPLDCASAIYRLLPQIILSLLFKASPSFFNITETIYRPWRVVTRHLPRMDSAAVVHSWYWPTKQQAPCVHLQIKREAWLLPWTLNTAALFLGPHYVQLQPLSTDTQETIVSNTISVVQSYSEPCTRTSPLTICQNVVRGLTRPLGSVSFTTTSVLRSFENSRLSLCDHDDPGSRRK